MSTWLQSVWPALVFEAPQRLWWAVPVLLLWGVFAVLQLRSHGWLSQHVHGAARGRFSCHSRLSLWGHLFLLLLMAGSLLLAMAAPVWRGEGQIRPPGALLLLIDASASMAATDTPPKAEDAPPASRFELAVELARGVVQGLPQWSLALATYSGETTAHLPLSSDRQMLADALRSVELHNYYQSTGSSLSKALESALVMATQQPGLQVLLISDGEISHGDDYSPLLSALAEQGVQVDTLGVGSLEGQGRNIFDFNDVFAGRKPARVLVEFHTRRVDEHLQRIAAATDGRFALADPANLADVVTSLQVRSRDRLLTIEDRAAQLDLSWLPLLLFAGGWLLDRLVIGWRAAPPPRPFDIARLGRKTAIGSSLLVLWVLACGKPLEQAHQSNERGIQEDAKQRHGAARRHYLRSIGYQVRSHIPTYNLARSTALREDYPAAHALFQKALMLEPGLIEAHYNDGMTLYRWGRATRDPEGCDLDRTQTLWRQAQQRFEHVVEGVEAGHPLAQRGRRNLAAVTSGLSALDALQRQPPAACKPPPSQGGGGTGSDQEGGGSGSGDTGGGGSGSDADGGGSGPGDSGPGDSGPDDSGPDDSGPDDSGPDDSGPGNSGPDHSVPGDAPTDGGGSDGDLGAPSASTGSPQSLTADERQQVQEHLARIAAQGQEEGKYHRRTLAEQFPRESWQNPEKEIRW